MTKQEFEEWADKESIVHANKYVAHPSQELEPWQQEKANDFVSGTKTAYDKLSQVIEAKDAEIRKQNQALDILFENIRQPNRVFRILAKNKARKILEGSDNE